MKLRISILAACASTLVLTATLAHAQSRAGEGFPGGAGGTQRTAAPAFGQPITFTAARKPALRPNEPAAGDVNRDGRRKRKTAEGGSAWGTASTTRGRKLQPGKTGRPRIFDRWGNTVGEVIAY